MDTQHQKEQQIVPSMKDDGSRALTVFARNPQEMSVAQAQLVRWCAGKLVELTEEADDLRANHETAIKGGWSTVKIGNQINRTRKRLGFYEKVKAALDAGYCIVPGFPIDIFAIRTGRPAPKANTVEATDTQPSWVRGPAQQQSESPALGEGAYMSTATDNLQKSVPCPPVGGKRQSYDVTTWADAFRDVDFPFALAQPAVLEATQQAMAARIFDELGVSPASAAARSGKGDPMVIGRIYAPGSKDWNRTQRSISFVVAWFLRPDQDLDF